MIRSEHIITARRESPDITLRDAVFWGICIAAALVLVTLFGGMLIADISFTSVRYLWDAVRTPEILHAIRLSLITSAISTILALLAGVPVSYLIARATFPGKAILETMLTIPLALPPLVVGISLLLLFHTPLGMALQRVIPITYTPIAIVIAQFPIAVALVVRTMRSCFQQIPVRQEHVAVTLGCSKGQVFRYVVLPQARVGLLTAAALAWSRTMGEFGSVLVFAGATRMRTEVLPSTIYLEMSVGHLEAALAVALLMMLLAVGVLVLIHLWTGRLVPEMR